MSKKETIFIPCIKILSTLELIDVTLISIKDHNGCIKILNKDDIIM